MSNLWRMFVHSHTVNDPEVKHLRFCTAPLGLQLSVEGCFAGVLEL